MNCHCEALLRRYLQATAVWLPSTQREDLTAELAEDLRSRIDDKKAGMGRDLSEDELVAILKERGHPRVVAGSYSSQQYLSGPAWFPIYRFLVKLVVLWIQLPLFALIIGPLNAVASGHPIAAVMQAVGNYATAAMAAFAAITVVFALLERYPGKTSRDWDPRRLSHLTIPKAMLDAEPGVWARGVAQAVFSLVFALGWQYVVQHWDDFAFGALGQKLEPILQATYWPLMLSLLAGIVQGVVTLLFPGRHQLRAGVRIANALFSLIAVFILFKLHAIEQFAAPFMPVDGQWIRFGLQLPLLIVAVAVIADAARELWQMKRVRPGHTWSMGTAAGK